MMWRRAWFLAAILLLIAWPAAAAANTVAVPGASGAAQAEPANNGFVLAIIVMIGMALAVIYSLAAAVRAGSGPVLEPGPAWTQTLIPVLTVIGMGIAAYLTFVETQNVAAVCGPVGNCNAVQSSPYARLFGFFPVGLLGLLGYVGILAAWIVARVDRGRLADLARLAAFGMALFGVLFSLYLTYLEPFVIRAVCIWCLSSAVVITLLMLLCLRPALVALSSEEEFEEFEEAEPG